MINFLEISNSMLSCSGPIDKTCTRPKDESEGDETDNHVCALYVHGS